MSRSNALVAGVAALSLLGSGCANSGPLLDGRTQRGGQLGTLGGAGIGGVDPRAGGARSSTATGAVAFGPVRRYLDQQAQELDAIRGAEVQRRDDSLVVSFSSQLLFGSGKSQLEAGAYDRLRSLARTLDDYPKSQITIKGHTDSVGDESFNERLSEDQADRVRALLVSEGVGPSRITAIGLGETQPVASNDNEAGRQQNRRVEIEIRPDAEVFEGAQ